MAGVQARWSPKQPPVKTRKACEATIERDQLALPLDGERGQVGIGHDPAVDPIRLAQREEALP